MAITQTRRNIIKLEQMINMLQKDVTAWMQRQPARRQDRLKALVDEYEQTVQENLNSAIHAIGYQTPLEERESSASETPINQLPKLMKMGLLIVAKDMLELEEHDAES